MGKFNRTDHTYYVQGTRYQALYTRAQQHIYPVPDRKQGKKENKEIVLKARSKAQSGSPVA